MKETNLGPVALHPASCGANNPPDPLRRQALSLLGASLTAALSGCCSTHFPKPQIKAARGSGLGIADGTVPGPLAPRVINTEAVPTTSCVDVHAHFFNASDVTVKGFLEGPVAFSVGGALGDLLRLLAPLAEALSGIAPTAKSEYDFLRPMSLVGTDPAVSRSRLLKELQSERQAISVEFNRLIQSPKGRKFRQAYARIMQEPKGASIAGPPRIRKVDESSLIRAMSLSESVLEDSQVRALAAPGRAPYGEGILAFIGYMLSSRWANLLTYQAAFTEKTGTIGVRRSLGLLVDFDRWLQCPPRSAHEDQMKLHLRLSQLSSSYMLPVISYNPWTDVVTHGRSLAIVEEAIQSGFVAVKIYPPNGFRPWGNAGMAGPHGAPTGAKLDAALQKLWLRCQELQVPVIAHAEPSMGSDNAHVALAGPPGWRDLLEARFWKSNEGPLVSLGHFGGDSDKGASGWTQDFAQLMGKPRGSRVYADLAYWDQLQCASVGEDICQKAEARLAAVLNLPLGNGQTVADRLMYGSDWLMLSREKNWPNYARQLQTALQKIAAPHVGGIFGENAQRCFGARLRLSSRLETEIATAPRQMF